MRGRPRSPDPLIKVTVRVRADDYEYLRKYAGEGELNALLRDLIHNMCDKMRQRDAA